MKLFKAMATVAGLTLVSRVLGFARDMALASVLGAGIVADAFFVAMKLPNFFRRVTAEGAFSVAFVPIYARLREKNGDKAALDFANLALSGMAMILAVFCTLAVVFMPLVVRALAPGFETGGERFDLAVQFSRVTFPFLLMASVAALMGGLLNAHSRFAPFASTSIILNACMLLFLVALTPLIGNAGLAVSWGITFSGLLQIVFLWWCAKREGLNFALPKPHMTQDIRVLLNKMGPGVVAAGIVQINLFVDVILASMLGTGAISYLYYADRLNQLPLGLIGVAIATALLPMMSSALARGDDVDSRNLFSRSLEFALVMTVPAAIALYILAQPIISTLFEHGAFTAQDAETTARVLQAYALGLVPFVVSKVLTTAFFARQNTMTPVKIGVFSALLNTFLCIVLMNTPLGIVGIALATAIAAWVQVLWLYGLLRGVKGAQADARLRRNTVIVLLSALVMGGLLLLSHLVDMGDAAEKTRQVLFLAAFAGAGGFLYLGLIWRYRVVNMDDIKVFLQRPKKTEAPSAADIP